MSIKGLEKYTHEPLPEDGWEPELCDIIPEVVSLLDADEPAMYRLGDVMGSNTFALMNTDDALYHVAWMQPNKESRAFFEAFWVWFDENLQEIWDAYVERMREEEAEDEYESWVQDASEIGLI